MMRGGGEGRIFYKPESGPAKDYKVYWMVTFKWIKKRMSSAQGQVAKKLQRKKSRFWAKEMIRREIP